MTTLVAAPEASAAATESRTLDLTVVIVSFNDRDWLDACLRSVYARAGNLALKVVVVDNGNDDAYLLVRENFPAARTLTTANHGFANANNVALAAADSRYVLLLNPDTEIVEGNLDDLIAELDRRPELGLAGVIQVDSDGELLPTIRYFPTVTRAFGEALGAERWGSRPRWLGERELDTRRYERETLCDWTSGSFMLIRRQALLSAGLLDERFFLYSEETDLCRRIRNAGWDIRHLPSLKIVHHAGRAGTQPRLVAQQAYARAQYARRHLQWPRSTGYRLALTANHALRATSPGSIDRRAASRLALLTLLGVAEPPYTKPPATAIPARNSSRPATVERSLLVISPVRNEAAHIEQVASALAAQSQPPAKWIVVDDSSTDETLAILQRLERGIEFLTVMQAEPRAADTVKDQLAQAPEVQSFNAALATIELDDYSHVMKLDGDIELAPDYLRSLFERLDRDPQLGLVGGVLVEPDGKGRLQPVPIPRHHVHGAIKLYTRECFKAIGGIPQRLGWDTIDETYARMRGFGTHSYPELVSTHHRPSASADGILRGRARHGECAYINHYPFSWVALRSLKVARSHPAILSGLAFLFGYVRAVLTDTEQVPDRAYREFTRRELRRRMLAAIPIAKS